jgi:hypothetical protein
MSEHPPNGELGGVLEELRAVTDDTRRVFGGLSAAQLNWKPSPEQWSVGQCFEHLIKTNRSFYPALEEVARGGRRENLWERISPLSGLFGWIVMRSLGSARKFPAPRALQPSASDVDAAVIGRFVEQQGELSGRMRAAEGSDLKRTVVTSPIAGFVTYSMFDACRIVVAHNRRHFAQARRVTEAVGFPRASVRD